MIGSTTARTGVGFNFLLTGALIVPLILLDRFTLAMFMPAGGEALEIARHLNHIAVRSFLFFGVVFVLAGVVRATGAVISPLIILGIAGASACRLPTCCSRSWAWMQSGGASRSARSAPWPCSWPTAAGATGAARACSPPEPEELAIPSEVPGQVPAPVADRCARVTSKR
jgi:hypothetical protein